MLPRWLPKKIRQFINLVDTPFDKMKHYLWRDRKLTKNYNYRIRVPMANKHYYGIEIAIYKKKGE